MGSLNNTVKTEMNNAEKPHLLKKTHMRKQQNKKVVLFNKSLPKKLKKKSLK